MRFSDFLSICPVGFLLVLPVAQAASGSWTNVASGDWSTGPWTGGVPNGSGETATFNLNWSGQAINVDGSYRVGQILATDTTAGGTLAISGGVLILDNGASKPVIGSVTFGEFARFKITSELQGTNGFEKTGGGYLDLTGSANTFTGNVKLNGGGGFVVINNDANLGNSANDIDVATTGSATGFYLDASVTAALNSGRSIITTGTGDFWVKNKAGASLTIDGEISGTANFRKNDSGTVVLTNANSYALATKLEGGTLRLSGGNNRLPTTTTVQFLNGTSILDLTNTTQSVAALTVFSGGTNTITGTGGSLTVTNNANFTVNGSDATILDLSGLTNFTYNQSTKNFVVQPATSATTSNNTVNLAKAGANNITAAVLTVGGATGTSQGTAHEGRLGLGKENNINTGTVNLGGFNGSGLINFQSGQTNPGLKLRGLGGDASAVDNVYVGSTSSGTRSGDGVMDLSAGSLDAKVTNLIINRHGASATSTLTSSLSMGSGTVEATNVVLARKSTNFGTGADTTGNPTLNANFTQGGGTVKVSNLVMGENTNSDVINILPVLKPSYNLNGGTLYAATIDGGVGGFNSTSSVRNLNISGGTLRNYNASTNLTVDGVDSSDGGRVSVIIGSAGATLQADASRTIELTANTRLGGSGNLLKTGDGTLVINGVATSYSGTLAVNAGTLAGAATYGTSGSPASITVGANGTLAPGTSPGTMTVTGNLTIAGTFAYEFNDVGDLADLVNVGGLLNLSGSTVQWNNLGAHAAGEKFALFRYNTGNLTGTFSGYADDNQYNFGGGGWVINYNDTLPGLNGGSGGAGISFVTLTAVPETSTALLGVIGMAGLLRRRRRAS